MAASTMPFGQRAPLCTQRRRAAPALVAVCVSALLAGASRAFVPAPASTPVQTSGLRAAAASAASTMSLLVPFTAHADLPPLEDLPVEELRPRKETSIFDDTWLGISPPVALFGVACAASWALFVVNNVVPKKEEDGSYKTYVGAGELPPMGYTNPLDPRMLEEAPETDDALYKKQKKAEKKKAAGSAIV